MITQKQLECESITGKVFYWNSRLNDWKSDDWNGAESREEFKWDEADPFPEKPEWAVKMIIVDAIIED